MCHTCPIASYVNLNSGPDNDMQKLCMYSSIRHGICRPSHHSQQGCPIAHSSCCIQGLGQQHSYATCHDMVAAQTHSCVADKLLHLRNYDPEFSITLTAAASQLLSVYVRLAAHISDRMVQYRTNMRGDPCGRRCIYRTRYLMNSAVFHYCVDGNG